MEKFDLKGYRKTLHFKERYRDRLEEKIGKFDLKKLNKRTYVTKVGKDGNVVMVDGEITIVINPQSKTLITCYLTSQKTEDDDYVFNYLKEIDKVLIKTQKEMYNDFLIKTDEQRKILNKNINIGRTTQPKDIKMKMDQVDKAMEELSREYTKMKNVSIQLEENNKEIHKKFKK